MPKAGKNSKLSRVARRVAAADPLPVPLAKTKTNDETTKDETKSGLSRGQKKRMAKRENYLRKERMIMSTLMLKRQDEQSKRIDGLDAIRDALVATTRDSKSVEKDEIEEERHINTSKAKQELVAVETERMKLVMQHPVFIKDPFAAMQEHLRNSLAKKREKLEKETKERTERDRIEGEKKKELKKERLHGVKKNRKKYKHRRTS